MVVASLCDTIVEGSRKPAAEPGSKSVPMPCTSTVAAACLPEPFHSCGRDFLVLLEVDAATGQCPILPVVASALQQSIERGKAAFDQAASVHGGLTLFHGQNAPPITLNAYIERLSKYSRCSPICFVMAFVYMDTLAQKDSLLQPCHLSVHRLLLAGVMVAAKFIDDGFFNNAFYAKIGGVSTVELNRLELEMLRLLDFRLFVQPELLWMYTKQLRAGVAHIEANLQHCRKRRSISGYIALGEERRTQRKNEAAVQSHLSDTVYCSTEA